MCNTKSIKEKSKYYFFSSFHSIIALIHKAKPFVCFFLLSFEKKKKEQHKKIFGEKAMFAIVEYFFSSRNAKINKR